MAIRQGLENKCYVVGQGLLQTPVAWATVTHVCEGAQISHSNTDVMEHVAWPQDFLQIVRKALGKYPRRRSKIPETFETPFWESYHQNHSNGFISIEMKPKLVTKSEFDYSFVKSSRQDTTDCFGRNRHCRCVHIITLKVDLDLDKCQRSIMCMLKDIQ